MADRTVTTVECAINEAEVLKTALETGVLRLFDETLTLDVNTTRADMIAAETTLVGYPSGGYPITAFTGPYPGSPGGVVIATPAIPIQYASGDAVVIGGWWIETGDPADKPYRAGVFEPKITLAAIPNGIDFIRSFPYGQFG